MTMTDITPTNLEICLFCRRPLGEVALRYINGELVCDDDTSDLATYGLIGAACRRQMELALHVIAHQETNIDDLYGELTDLFEKYGLIAR